MLNRRALLVGLTLSPFVTVLPARATSSYAYGADDYLPIDKATSPDGHFSILAHGEGDLGSENFNLHLALEPDHRRIGTFFTEDTPYLDTDPVDFHAVWAPDSTHVGIRYRADRRFVDTLLYSVTDKGAVAVQGPDLFLAALGHVDDEISSGLNNLLRTLTWTGVGTFVLAETRVYKTKAKMAASFKTYGRKGETIGDDMALIPFSAVADCRLSDTTAFKVERIRPGDFKY
jgi:hypothetical protein